MASFWLATDSGLSSPVKTWYLKWNFTLPWRASKDFFTRTKPCISFSLQSSFAANCFRTSFSLGFSASAGFNRVIVISFITASVYHSGIKCKRRKSASPRFGGFHPHFSLSRKLKGNRRTVILFLELTGNLSASRQLAKEDFIHQSHGNLFVH